MYTIDIVSTAKQISVTALIRRISLLVVILLPFQRFPQTVWSGGAVDTENIPIFLKMMSFIDEASFFVFFAMLISFILLRPEYYRIKRFPFTKWFLFFILVCLGEIGVNRVPMTQGVFGIYDYVKNIAVIFLFAGVNFDEERGSERRSHKPTRLLIQRTGELIRRAPLKILLQIKLVCLAFSEGQRGLAVGAEDLLPGVFISA